jgi:hypothetical protein
MSLIAECRSAGCGAAKKIFVVIFAGIRQSVHQLPAQIGRIGVNGIDRTGTREICLSIKECGKCRQKWQQKNKNVDFFLCG